MCKGHDGYPGVANQSLLINKPLLMNDTHIHTRGSDTSSNHKIDEDGTEFEHTDYIDPDEMIVNLYL